MGVPLIIGGGRERENGLTRESVCVRERERDRGGGGYIEVHCSVTSSTCSHVNNLQHHM